MRSAFALRIISGKNILFVNRENLRIFPIYFFTGGVVAANSICSAAFCESAALRVVSSPFFMGKSATVDRQFSSTTPSVKIITPRENAGFAERPHRGHNTSRA